MKLDDHDSKPGRDDRYVSQIDAYTRKHHDTVRLLDYLRALERTKIANVPPLEPLLAKLIADILDGTLSISRSKFRWPDLKPKELRSTLEIAKKLIAKGDSAVLENLGLKYPPETKGEINKLAMRVAGQVYFLGPGAFEGRLYPRKGRNKKG